MTRPELCVGAVVIDDERILMVRRGHGPAAGTWSIPGGRVESGETVREAVVRELFEETAVEGLCGPLIGWVERFDEGLHWVALDFEVGLLGDAAPAAGDDAQEAAWVPLDEVAERQVAPGLAEFLHDHGIIETIT